MKVAVYSRKSKFTGKGESTQNQINMCKEYANSHFEVTDFFVYEDEGFSGGNADRPKYKQMIRDAENCKFDVLMCYRLDRISRNIGDFSSTIETLQSKNISFVSLREQFDTSTPMGRAMMYIASVFAQLERETAAERITDNMRSLARSGRWLGGNTPTGFESESIVYIDSNMKEKKMYKLTPVTNELDTVKLIFEKYLELGSLNQVLAYTLEHNIKTKRNKDFHRYGIRKILANPVYAKASEEVYNYFISNDAQICNDKTDFDNSNGIMTYNKVLVKKGTSNKVKDMSEWIVAVGKHKGIIEGKDWVRVQRMILTNKSKAPAQGSSKAAMLSGLLKCSECGSYMRVKYGKKIKSTNKRHFYYVCSMKTKSKSTRCTIQNLLGKQTDELVIEELKSIINSGILKNLKDMELENKNKEIQFKRIEDKIQDNKKSIDNLVKQLSKTENDNVSKYILDEIDKLDKENTKLESKLNEENTTSTKINIALLKASMVKFMDTIDKVDVDMQFTLIKNIVKEILWDGENLEIKLLDID